MAYERPEIPLPDGYPDGLSDEELPKAIRRMLEGWSGVVGGTKNLSGMGGEIILSFVLLGFAEQARRNVTKAGDSARRTASSPSDSRSSPSPSPSLSGSSPPATRGTGSTSRRSC